MKRSLTALILLTLSAMLAGCAGSPFSPMEERQPPSDSGFVSEIPPQLSDLESEKGTGTVYFRLGGEGYLVSVQVEIDILFGQTAEEAVIRATLEGPGAMHDLTALFPSDMKLVSVSERSGYIEVVLSRDLERPAGDTAAELRNRLAVYSIVNAVTELGKYSKVMFMIQGDNSSPVRMTLESAGILPMLEGEGTSMDPLPRNADVILTPERAADMVLSAMRSQDAESVDTIRRFSVMPDGLPPDEHVVSQDIFSEGTISDYVINGAPIVSPGGQSAVALIDYESLSSGQRRTMHTDISLRLVRDSSSVWRVDYESLCALKAVSSQP